MKRLIQSIICFYILLLHSFCIADQYDLTLIGRVTTADGLCRIPISIIDMLKNEIKINHITPFNYAIDPLDIREDVKNIFCNPNKTPGNVAILVDGLWAVNAHTYAYVPDSPIKIAYSMWESNQIPTTWVKVLNQYFDAVAVPDSFVMNTYKKCGVTIPIFELPLCLNLHEFINKKKRSRPGIPFVFGCTATACQNKNQALLIKAFAQEFGNDPNVFLRLSSRWAVSPAEGSWEKLIKSYGCNNISIDIGILDNKQYMENMDTFDCYVNISKGEGYSIGPREALALGIPCIITNNSAQQTIAKSGLVRMVPAEIPAPPPTDCDWAGTFGNEDIGYYADCSLKDVKQALRDVYEQYDIYFDNAKKGSEWVSQYDLPRMKEKYFNLIKPKKIILGNQNVITDDYLMTTSESLYNKYLGIGIRD